MRTLPIALILVFFALFLPVAALAVWVPGGAPVCTATGEQSTCTITTDDFGGAIVAWQDLRNGNVDIFVQRINAAGVPQWTANGVALCTAAHDQTGPKITPDGAGGAIVVWSDYRSNTNNDIYAQRIDATGAVQWTANGVAPGRKAQRCP